MSEKVAFIGHSIFYVKQDMLLNAIENEIKSGCKFFTMGTHGNFDEQALSACLKLRHKYKDITIELVFTSLHKFYKGEHRENGKLQYSIYDNVETIFYDVEMYHYKQKIIESNKRMIDKCDTLICNYIPDRRGGTKIAVDYAKKKGKRIINLYEEPKPSIE